MNVDHCFELIIQEILKKKYNLTANWTNYNQQKKRSSSKIKKLPNLIKKVSRHRSKENNLTVTKPDIIETAKKHYNEDIIDQLVLFGYGTRDDIINVSQKVVNYNDINEIVSYLMDRSRSSRQNSKSDSRNRLIPYDRRPPLMINVNSESKTEEDNVKSTDYKKEREQQPHSSFWEYVHYQPTKSRKSVSNNEICAGDGNGFLPPLPPPPPPPISLKINPNQRIKKQNDQQLPLINKRSFPMQRQNHSTPQIKT
eukprot:81424_1